MKKVLLLAISALPLMVIAQGLHFDIYAGAANYQGEMTQKRVDFSNAGLHLGGGLSYDISNHLIGRVAFNYIKLSGADATKSNNIFIQRRNLDFKTNVTELQMALEYNLLSLQDNSFTPYVFAGGVLYHFDPYTTLNGSRVFLRPLGTEGQGLSQYPDKKIYKSTQFSVPLGAGIKLRLSDRLQAGAELGFRKLFTDYLDDVSGTYADSSALFAGRGPLAVAAAYRGAAKGGGNYPAGGTERGNPDQNDFFYSTTFRLSYELGGLRSGKEKLGCPTKF